MENQTYQGRFYFVIGFILLLVACLTFRLLDLTVLDKKFLQRQGDIRALRTVSAPAFRGMITDRYGSPLAVSTAVYSIWLDPQEVDLNADYTQLGNLIGMDPDKIATLIKNAEAKNREFLYLKRELPPAIAKQVISLKIPGINLQEDFKRFYPAGEIAAHVIGFTNLDDKGQEGLELLYNDWLSGSPGKKLVVKDRLGRNIETVKIISEQQPGKDITLSIDKRIQYLAYRELLSGVEENAAAGGSVVILEAKTGEVLAMVNLPSYNPNNRANDQVDIFRNRAATDIFEPGSTLKAFSVAAALESGLYKPDSIIDTGPGWFRVGRHIVRDEHSSGPLSVAQILQISSDVGVSKMILNLPPNSFWRFLKRLGFGDTTGIGFPGEEQGKLTYRNKWDPFALATLSFGYSISVTALQLAHAYDAIANQGVMMPLTLLKPTNPPQGKVVLSPQLANTMLSLLESVVNTKASKGIRPGTGRKASVPGYRIAGKTGTSRMIGPHGYIKRYVSSFVGIAPVSNPRLVVAVIVKDPRGKVYLGQDVSAPIFQRIMEGSLRMLDIPPDNLPTLQTANKNS